jgi:flagellar basal-body rod modification protein FlgD
MEQSAANSAAMLTAQRAQTASDLVGKTVSYAAADGTVKTGLVTAATISGSDPSLKIGNTSVTLAQVQQVLAGPPPATAAAALPTA